MCLPKTPDIPSIPDRQASKLPDNGATATRSDDSSSRRRALMATILTSGQGVLGTPSVTKLGA